MPLFVEKTEVITNNEQLSMHEFAPLLRWYSTNPLATRHPSSRILAPRIGGIVGGMRATTLGNIRFDERKLLVVYKNVEHQEVLTNPGEERVVADQQTTLPIEGHASRRIKRRERACRSVADTGLLRTV